MALTDIRTDLWETLKERDLPLALYGTGDGADKIIHALKTKGLMDKVKAVFASDGFVRDRFFAGFKVRSFDDTLAEFGPSGFITLLCFGSSRSEVLNTIDKIRSKTELYAPDVPVCGTELFDYGFYKANESRLEAVFRMLGDEDSKDIFRNVINFKLSGDIKYLDLAVSEPDEDLLLSGVRGGFIDLGAYNGDTLARYLDLLPGISSSAAVEPERHSYKKLVKMAEELSAKGARIDTYNALAGSTPGTALVTSAHGRGTRNAGITGQGAGITNLANAREISVVTIDKIAETLGGTGFIKFDVEGEEINAIKGGTDTIKRFKPALKIACYHRSPDLFEIPEQILKIRSDYRIYLRRLKGVPCWDLDYYFV